MPGEKAERLIITNTKRSAVRHHNHRQILAMRAVARIGHDCGDFHPVRCLVTDRLGRIHIGILQHRMKEAQDRELTTFGIVDVITAGFRRLGDEHHQFGIGVIGAHDTGIGRAEILIKELLDFTQPRIEPKDALLVGGISDPQQLIAILTRDNTIDIVVDRFEHWLANDFHRSDVDFVDPAVIVLVARRIGNIGFIGEDVGRDLRASVGRVLLVRGGFELLTGAAAIHQALFAIVVAANPGPDHTLAIGDPAADHYIGALDGRELAAAHIKFDHFRLEGLLVVAECGALHQHPFLDVVTVEDCDVTARCSFPGQRGQLACFQVIGNIT